MKLVLRCTMVISFFLIVYACNNKPAIPKAEEVGRKKIEMLTDYGSIQIELYNETPLHRDNFIKLVKEGVYDSVLFHRVIDSFMI